MYIQTFNTILEYNHIDYTNISNVIFLKCLQNDIKDGKHQDYKYYINNRMNQFDSGLLSKYKILRWFSYKSKIYIRGFLVGSPKHISFITDSTRIISSAYLIQYMIDSFDKVSRFENNMTYLNKLDHLCNSTLNNIILILSTFCKKNNLVLY